FPVRMPSSKIAATSGQSSGPRSRISIRVRVGTRAGSAVVVQGELHRMRPEAHRVDLVLALPRDPGLDEVLAEDVALEQELVVRLERVERLRERPGHLLDAVVVLEKVEVGRLARVEAALDAVEARHQHGGEGEIRVRRRIRAAELDALRLR